MESGVFLPSPHPIKLFIQPNQYITDLLLLNLTETTPTTHCDYLKIIAMDSV